MFRVSAMCRVLNASKGGFYAWLRRQPGLPERRDQELRLKIVAIHEKSEKRYGSPRIHATLRDDHDERCGCKRVARLMREARIAGKRRKRFVPRTTDSKHKEPIAENIFERTFDPAVIDQPNRIWSGDITYIWTAEGWLYLAIVLDLFRVGRSAGR